MSDAIEDRARELAIAMCGGSNVRQWAHPDDVRRVTAALRAEGNRRLEDAAQASRDQTCDHPSFVGDWNDACEHVATRILALRT